MALTVADLAMLLLPEPRTFIVCFLAGILTYVIFTKAGQIILGGTAGHKGVSRKVDDEVETHTCSVDGGEDLGELGHPAEQPSAALHVEEVGSRAEGPCEQGTREELSAMALDEAMEMLWEVVKGHDQVPEELDSEPPQQEATPEPVACPVGGTETDAIEQEHLKDACPAPADAEQPVGALRARRSWFDASGEEEGDEAPWLSRTRVAATPCAPTQGRRGTRIAATPFADATPFASVTPIDPAKICVDKAPVEATQPFADNADPDEVCRSAPIPEGAKPWAEGGWSKRPKRQWHQSKAGPATGTSIDPGPTDAWGFSFDDVYAQKQPQMHMGPAYPRQRASHTGQAQMAATYRGHAHMYSGTDARTMQQMKQYGNRAGFAVGPGGDKWDVAWEG